MKEYKYLLVELLESEAGPKISIIKPIFASNEFDVLQLYADEKYLPSDDIRFRQDHKHFNIRKDDENELPCPYGTVIVQYENDSRFYRGMVYPRAYIIKLDDKHREQTDDIMVL